jgi:hypothetical protein
MSIEQALVIVILVILIVFLILRLDVDSADAALNVIGWCPRCPDALAGGR